MFIRSSEEFLGATGRNSKFVNPLQPLSSDFIPENMEDSYKFCEEAWYRISKLQTGVDRMVGYMVTRVDIDGVEKSKKEQWEELLDDRMDILNVLMGIGRDLVVYNNSFSSLYFPFIRYIQCKECGTQVRSDSEGVNYTIDKEGEFYWDCVKCGHSGEVRVKDKLIDNPEKVRVIKWNPKEIKTANYNPITGEREYIWKMPEDFISKVKDYENNTFGDTLPRSMISCAMQGKDLGFNKGQILHLTRSELSGVDSKEIGIPKLVSIFPEIFSRNLMKRFNEVVGLDYMYPLRIYTPATHPKQPPQTGEDPLRNAGMQGTPDMTKHLESMVAKMRRDPTSIFTSPFEVREGTVGGIGVELLRPELMEYTDNNVLEGVNIPIEIRESNLQAHYTPEAMRTMERSWGWLNSLLNTWLSWMMNKVSKYLNYEKADIKLAPPSVLDDLMRRNLLLQLYQQGAVSEVTGLEEPWGINLDDEKDNLIADVRRRIETEKAIEEETKALEQTEMLGQPMMPGGQGQGQPPLHPGLPMQPGQPGGGMGMGGTMPMAGGGSVPELTAEAEQVAQQMLSMDPSMRKSSLIELSKQNETLHALVTHKIKQMRGDVDQEGAAMARQEVFGTT